MDISNEYLKSWLNFDISATTDVIADNFWTAIGTPTISATNALSNTALQLDGQSYVYNTISLNTSSFTVDGFFYVNSADLTSERKRLVGVNKGNVNFFSIDIETNGKISYWTNSKQDLANANSGTLKISANTVTDGLHHFAFVKQSGVGFALYVDGIKVCYATNTLNYPNPINATVYIGGTSSGVLIYKGTIDEFRLYSGVALWTSNFTPPTASEYESWSLQSALDAVRIVTVPASKWCYENAGEIDTLINTSTAVKLTNLPVSQSKTGSAFYQNTDAIKLFDVASSYEVWIKFDVYSTEYGSWNLWDYSSNMATGLSAQSTTNLLKPLGLSIYNNDTELTCIYNELEPDKLQTFILHMRAAVSDGLIEVYSQDGGLLYAYAGAVNGGTAFSMLNLVTVPDEDFDPPLNGQSYFSNVLISNEPLWFDDNVAITINTGFTADVERTIDTTVVLTNDMVRILLASSHDETVSVDMSREIVVSPAVEADAERVLSGQVVVVYDVQRDVMGPVALDVDTQRVIGFTQELVCDLSRAVVYDVELANDTQRDIAVDVDYLADAMRQLPYQVAVDGTETSPIHISSAGGGLQSITIQIAEQQITDRVSFVHAGDCGIMDKIQGNYLDYNFNLRIEETSKQGVLQSCNCCSDIDEILYSQLAYIVPEEEWKWPQDYEAEYLQAKQQDAELEKIPSTTVEEHLRSIAKTLSKSLVYRGMTWYSTLDTDELGGRTYADILSELAGWSSRLPHLMINIYIRGGRLYVIQRGYEANTVSLNNAKIANLKVSKKLVRTTWGSDVWSKTEVKTKPIFTFQYEQAQEPSGGSGVTTDVSGLIETKRTESDTALDITTYYYKQDETGGGKYLYQEVTEKYERSGWGQSWEYVDTIITSHDKVSTNQSYIYAQDSSGSILGSTLSQNKFDDRVTPYDSISGFAFYTLPYVIKDGKKVYMQSYWYEKSGEQEYSSHTVYGLSLIDTSFPVYGDDALTYLTNQIAWLNRKTEETISMDVYDLSHVIGFDDKISYNGAIYHLKSNTVLQDERTVNKQSLTFVRWY